jgi:hypothetical protein
VAFHGDGGALEGGLRLPLADAGPVGHVAPPSGRIAGMRRYGRGRDGGWGRRPRALPAAT